MYRIGNISPLRSRQPLQHERHASEQILRPRPISIAAQPPTMQHTKRSSIYVSDASILLQHKNPILSPVSPNDAVLSTGSDTPSFVDHYSSLELESNASIDEVRAAFRRLRGLYFTTDAVKYRAAQAAFDVLANPAARQDYDMIYRSRPAPNNASLGDVLESKHGRKDSAHSENRPIPVVEEEEEEAGSPDPNWALKRHRRLYEPVIGTQPYQSFIPILHDYTGRERHPVLKSRRPVYIGEAAINARPN
ncbi:hypothetical protein EK21DRAFT_68384 [Setomelanomma holmii]|uniref:J domain-containing protein n=1 Tax=Setomelanomma holmii TaxID=210430 RepID=A0A9P4H7F1_9PLEO|nr:hypothetical protein EK21DRAFT_68384 [Setomelanomma holmii]